MVALSQSAFEARLSKARAAREVRFKTRLDWLGDRVAAGLKLSAKQGVQVASQLLRDRVVINISRPVMKRRTSQGRNRGRFTAVRTIVTGRSKPGEFPKADTTRLMKDIFSDVEDRGNAFVGRVGTTLDYGLILETKMDRSFLVRTLMELRPQLTKALTRPGGGGGFGVAR